MIAHRRALALAALLAPLAGCDDGGGADPTDAAPPIDGAPADAAPASDAGPPADLGPLPSLEAVPGDLTYVVYEGGAGRIWSVQADGDLRRPVAAAGPWGAHVVGPDPRFIAALRADAALPDGRPDPEAPATVWMIDVREQTAWPLSPPGCDAAYGGIGWRNEALVMFAAACDGERARAWVYPADARDRDPALLLAATAHEAGDVRDVFPVVDTPYFAYTLSTEVCAGGVCVDKPGVWIGDAELGTGCQVTDGDPAMLDTATVEGGGRLLGDHAPAFTRDLQGLVFSRNVAGKPAGPGGHFDVFRVGIDPAAFGGDPGPRCDQGGSLVQLTGNGVDERFLTADGGEAAGHERRPQPSAGSRAPVGALLITGQTFTAAGATSAIWVIDLAGARRAVTSPSGFADFGRWIIDDYMLTGER